MIIECPRCHSRYDSSLNEPGTPISCRCGQRFYTPRLPSKAKAVNCPNCGGAASPEQNKCDYCGVYLAFARCPGCFSIAPYRGAKYCAECGDALTQPAKAVKEANRKFPCPRCNAGKSTDKHRHNKKYLERKKVDEYVIDSCPECGGVWLDHSVLDKLLKQSNQQKSAQAVLGKDPVQASNLIRHKVMYLSCPECDQMMHRRNFGKKSGVIIDECTAHGIWFDKQELAAALHFARSSLQTVQHVASSPDIEMARMNARYSKPVKPARDNHLDVGGGDLLDLLLELPSLFK